jgi:DNA polymerase III subunit epsilon
MTFLTAMLPSEQLIYHWILMLPCYVLLDLETTGGNPLLSRITEVAAVRFEQGQEVARWSSLVNPDCTIPYFIQKLTGISDKLVEHAPSFKQVSEPLLALLNGAVLVAHNARFDHGFLVHEFARIGVELNVKTLCTVRLSRKLYPEHKGHGLDAIMQRHGLSTTARHRAMGDVDLMVQWLAMAMHERGADVVHQHALKLLQGSAAVPPQLETDIKTIPDTPGVYLFYGEGPIPLYIGKSVTLRSRVMSHFQSSITQPREMRMAQEIRRIEWRDTAGELGALLLEARLVKELQPIYNRQLRRERSLCAWALADDPAAKPLLTLVRGEELQPSEFAKMYGVFRSKSQAVAALHALVQEHALCPQALGLEAGKGRCFAHQLGRCKGVCCGEEKPALHRLRLQLALAKQQLQVWPHQGKIGLREHSEATGRTDIHIFDQWCHLATVHDAADLEDALTTNAALAFDLDTYRLLVKHLNAPAWVRKTQLELIALGEL